MSSELLLCPCCGKPVQGGPSAEMLALALHLTPMQAAILRTVMAGGGQSVPTKKILLAMYPDPDDKPDPDRAYLSFKQAVSRMRPRLESIGMRIVSAGYGCGWRAVWVD